ncbi:MAG: PAS domain S-box protein [Campylobacterales bacterium]|nr:PAS domain S-box protein [Campylobacterales bacterium]
MFRVIDLAIVNRSGMIQMDPKEWFELSSASIDKLRTIELYNIAMIESKLDSRIVEAQNTLVRVAVLLSLIIVLIFWFGYRISESIRKNIKLLDEYKNAVDRSSIVSKTDRKGRITYINDQFCAISGYSRDELIGKPHSIVRHEDTPKEVFVSMWQTILSGDAWHGVVKNKAKDGSPYWVDATINPILDHKGKIEEFIAIRSDITKTIRLHEELEQTQQEMINRIGEIGETRSRETGYHVRRVAEYSRLLAKKYGLSPEEINMLASASPMHDIGKVGIPDHILNKPGSLTSEEWEVMRSHSKIGYDLFRDSERPMLKAAAIIAHEHHEKFDGSGYPRGLKGEDIHIFGRITALADVFDALGSDRCYKKAWETDRILNLLKEERGKHFDPVLIDIFFNHLNEFLAIRDAYSDKNYYEPDC